MACHSAASPVTPEALTRDANALLVGVVTGATLSVPPKTVGDHPCGVCLLAPGMYCLYAACMDVLDREGGIVTHSGDDLPVTVEPLYILVQ